jgi:hypothetical protein
MCKNLREIGSVEFLLSEYEIKSTDTMKEGQYLSPQTAPALCDSAVLSSQELSHLRGGRSSGGETPVSVQVSFEHFSRAGKYSPQILKGKNGSDFCQREFLYPGQPDLVHYLA